MASWSDLFDLVLPEVPGCDITLAEHHIRRAAIEFCERSRAWRIDHPTLDTTGDQATVALAPGDELVMVEIEQARLSGVPLETRSDETQIAEDLGTEYLTIVGTPRFVTRNDEDTARLWPIPDVTSTGGALELVVSVAPDTDATGMDDKILRKWREALAHGAKASLMGMPKKPWSNPQLALWCKSEFEAAIGRASVRASRNLTRRPNRTAPSYI